MNDDSGMSRWVALAFAAAVTMFALVACTSTNPTPAGSGSLCSEGKPADTCQTLCDALCAKFVACGETATSCREQCFSAHVDLGENCDQDRSICRYQPAELSSASCADVCAWTSTSSWRVASKKWFVCIDGDAAVRSIDGATDASDDRG